MVLRYQSHYYWTLPVGDRIERLCAGANDFNQSRTRTTLARGWAGRSPRIESSVGFQSVSLVYRSVNASAGSFVSSDDSSTTVRHGLKQNEAQSACTESTHKGVNQRAKDVTQTQQRVLRLTVPGMV